MHTNLQSTFGNVKVQHKPYADIYALQKDEHIHMHNNMGNKV